MTEIEAAPASTGGAAGEALPDPATWGARNSHDPTAVRDDDGVYWLFSTDADADGPLRSSGAQIRRSTDLVSWEFVGCALDGVPAPARAHAGAEGLWAPDVVRVETAAGVQWRMYYSASSFGSRTSAIGLAVAPHPAGPWEDRGIVVATVHDRDGHNAIDAQLVIDGARHHLAYGSFFGGLHLLEIDPATGFALDAPAPGAPASSPGTLIARRPRSVDTAIEGPFILPRPGGGWALIVSYDSLVSTYHVRVAVAEDLYGPYVDPDGHEMTDLDADPLTVGLTVLASHQLEGGRGVLAPGHASVLTEPGHQLLVHHTRFVDQPRQHEVQVRRLVWTQEGWPLVSIQPWGGSHEDDDEAAWPSDVAALRGDWEIVDLGGPTDQVAPARRVTVDDAALAGLVPHGRGRFTRSGDAPVDAVVFPAWDTVRGRETLAFAARGPRGTVVVGTAVPEGAVG
ncbi:arabinan endo-1,5-alpha-L-arabinosidase [Demequina sp. SYSU T00039]|uniref:Arabinan endo-1,5-alpha-L-arabinosidase n=1 Tax=Demequina lignilytica TaxID=3051663 RepID=A0AAW7M2P1_9MICO|nr:MULTISPECIES: arabinan endo-1,5-alpha-L-arabinosidase [unclassified Demequina]MDN4479222.1 arabinan endo-1,5-alpha-L-arabinosidase [Demequina sp. SYSU T00039-1]MDN4487919.1 arabinan endo-1,5-alpha-L-arabinosidase [Demequina sp. SYSU T00039]MDN4491725.1 arabinan endo-1,5-alpha-L-arabinosidase [Demequina sp. SYSU T00068]